MIEDFILKKQQLHHVCCNRRKGRKYPSVFSPDPFFPCLSGRTNTWLIISAPVTFAFNTNPTPNYTPMITQVDDAQRFHKRHPAPGSVKQKNTDTFAVSVRAPQRSARNYSRITGKRPGFGEVRCWRTELLSLLSSLIRYLVEAKTLRHLCGGNQRSPYTAWDYRRTNDDAAPRWG